jgi:thioesterase domain-containing protein
VRFWLDGDRVRFQAPKGILTPELERQLASRKEEIVEILHAADKGWSPPWQSLVAIQAGGSKPPLFLVHGIGGGVLNFAHLANRLGSNQPLYGLQSQGLDGQQAPLTRVEPMAQLYVDEILKLQPKGPYHLGGMCFGGAIAFEMAQQIGAMGEKVDLLVLIDTWMPSSRLLQRFISLLHPLFFIAQGIGRHSRALAGLHPREWLVYLRKKLRIIKEMIVKKDLYRGDRSILYENAVTAANYEALSAYEPRPYPGKVHLILAEDRVVKPAFDTRMEWAKLAQGGYSDCWLRGEDSGLLFVEPNVAALADSLTVVLGDRVDDAQRVGGMEPATRS